MSTATKRQYNKDYFEERTKLGLCHTCGNSSDTKTTRCSICSAISQTKRRKLYVLRQNLGFCVFCGKDAKPYSLCLDCRIKKTSKNHNTKREVIEYFGGKCKTCGEKRLGCLELDHIEEDGFKHRKETKTRGGLQFYTQLVKSNFQTQYKLQVLCANCHALRHWMVEID